MRSVRLGDIVRTSSGATPLSTRKEFYDNATIPWINSGEVGQYKITKAEKFINEEGFKNSNTKFIPKGSVLLAMYGATAGKTSLLEIEGATSNQAICAIHPCKEINSPFLKYKLDTLYHYLVGISSGSARDNLSQTVIQNLVLDIPNPETQQAIADVLSSLDDKIELNNRINAELEKLAKLMYDYWFVQYDFPNAEGKPYRSSGGKMVYNETLKRDIPEGWEVKKLGKVLRTFLGGTPSTKIKEFWEGDIPWMNSGEVANFPLIATEQSITQEAIKKSSTKLMKKGSVLLSITRHLRANILGVDACINQSIAGIEENDQFKSPYIYLSVVKDIDRLMTLRTGAQQPHINKEIVDDSLFVVPKKVVLDSFYDLALPIFEKILNNAQQNAALASLRDWLLPMLMNGQAVVGSKAAEAPLSMAAEEAVAYGPGPASGRLFP